MPWKNHSVPVYWSLQDDGAPIRCSDCQENKPNNKVYLTMTPNGNRSVICIECLDEDWLKSAEHLGNFNYRKEWIKDNA